MTSGVPSSTPAAARRGLWFLLVLAAVAAISVLALAGSANGWFSVGAQVVSNRVSRDAINEIRLPTPLRDGATTTALPRFHVYLGSPDQAATFFRQQLPTQGFRLEREWASSDKARFQIWRRGDARVHIAMQAPFTGPPQPTRIGLSITPFAQPPLLP